MATPILTPALKQLRSDFNATYPHRSKASDGWIGDTAHQGSTSGHNPDDTPGVRAERSDADNIPEVRSIDVDVDLVPGDRTASRLETLRQIRRIIATPRDRRRLIYIIFDGLIWSASRGWQSHEYTGANKHREHAHYSNHPDYDNDGSAWSVETGADVALNTGEAKALAYTNRRVEALGTGTDDMVTDDVASTPQKVWAVQQLKSIGSGVSAATSAANQAMTLAGEALQAVQDNGVLLTEANAKLDDLVARMDVEIDYEQLARELIRQLGGGS